MGPKVLVPNPGKCRLKEGIVIIPFFQTNEFLVELGNTLRSPTQGVSLKQQLEQKEGELAYFETEFQLKHKLATLLTGRRPDAKKRNFIFSDAQVGEAVDYFLRERFHKKLGGCPSEQGLHELKVELDHLCLVTRRSNLFGELENYFELGDLAFQNQAAHYRGYPSKRA